MIKFPLIALTALVVAGGLAAPAFAASDTSGQTPYCPTGTSIDHASRIDSLSAELQLSGRQHATIDEWAGCLKVTTLENGATTMSFYDPDSLKLVAVI